MIQTNVKIENVQAEFLKHFSDYGFQDERGALNRLKDNLEEKSLV